MVFLLCQGTELSTGEGVPLSSRHLVRIRNVSTSPTGQGGEDDLGLGKEKQAFATDGKA